MIQRLLFRKIIKGFEEQESILVDYELRIHSLEVQLEKARPRKRKKVKTSLNSKFIDIKAIYKAQIVAREARIKEEEEEIASLSDSTLDYIKIK